MNTLLTDLINLCAATVIVLGMIFSYRVGEANGLKKGRMVARRHRPKYDIPDIPMIRGYERHEVTYKKANHGGPRHANDI